MRSYTIPHSIMRQIEAGNFGEFRKTLQDFKFDSIILTEYIPENASWPGQLLKALHKIPIISIDLSNNSIDPQCATAIANNLHYVAQLRVLKLDRNHIRDAGAIALAKSLKNTSYLTQVDLGWNHIGDRGAAQIIKELPYAKNLTDLYLHYNDFVLEDVKSLAVFLPKSKVLNFKYKKLFKTEHPMNAQIKRLIKQYLGFNQRKADLLRLRQEASLNPSQLPPIAANASSNNNNFGETPSPALIFSANKNNEEPEKIETDISIENLNNLFSKKTSLNKKH